MELRTSGWGGLIRGVEGARQREPGAVVLGCPRMRMTILHLLLAWFGLVLGCGGKDFGWTGAVTDAHVMTCL